MSRQLAFAWRWSWLPALALLAWLVPWCRDVYRHFATFGIERDVVPFRVRLGELAHATLQADLRRAQLRVDGLLGDRRDDGDASPLRTIDLAIGDAAIAKLDADLPYSGRTRVPGTVTVAGVALSADVRYRGDTYAHWGRSKKSFRIRLLGDARLDGRRVLNLVAPKYPEQLNNHASYRLAAHLGLLAPRSELVQLTLDGRRHGLYVLVEQPSLELVAAAGRQPGTLCIGELLGRDLWLGVPRELFGNPGVWDLDVLARPRANGAEPGLAALLAALQAPGSDDTAAAIEALVDIEQFARLSVLEQLTQTHHLDHFHNWRLHWDPRRRRFEPLVWDPVGWQATMPPRTGTPIDRHPVFTSLHARLHAHAGFLAARDRCLRAFFATGGDRELVDEVEGMVAATAACIAADPHPWPGDPAAVATAQRELVTAVRDVLAELRATWASRPPAVAWSAPRAATEALRLQVDGDRPAEGLRLRFAGVIAPARVELRVLRVSGREETLDLAGHWRAEGASLDVRITLPAALEPVLGSDGDLLRGQRLIATPTRYDVLLHGVDMRTLQAVTTGRDATADCRRVDALAPLPVRALFALRSACW